MGIRSIEFRGKTIDEGEWVYGDLTQYKYDICNKDNILYGENNKCFISSVEICDDAMSGFENAEVIPETVGQFTGLNDSNGVKIFEGDIVKCRHEILHIDLYPDKKDKKPRRSYGHEIGYENDVYGTGAYLEYWRNYEVKFNFCKGEYILNNGSDRHYFYDNYIRHHEIQVIGNVYDDPDLLKGEGKQ